MSNLVSFEGKDNQQPLWDAMGELLGDQIMAVHFKGKNFAPDGTMLHTSLEDACTDYAGAFAMLRTLPQAVARSARGGRARPRCQRYCFYQTVFLRCNAASFCPTGPEYLH